ncbi:nucleoside triphosphate pyrophosphohydrolase MazG [Halorhodospira halochloris]|uniref:Nucleoside triphosphate pyrophosphohydrolase n=1 Tax=Halorhodospira halochloris TaxID=1052 RepID=A0A0X8X8L0_HALHR|nr:nucleoside triphosphate pyrophosphohydrolase [Halorhodospira halochloris]MBK1651261.1 nucleoside triphosphate pyrophosphohydrolase [Halorhodospira halochloris]BAU57539.2 nucleoside triphosphate pyrophosphohydrolase MazG [Halorhodospira halochloris]
MDSIARLLRTMAQLRDPEGGCPWDIEQDFASIAPKTIEEAYEVAEAIESGDLENGLKDELGDLLLHVIFHAQMASEQNLFNFQDVAQALQDKLIRRHPHVFGNLQAADADGVVDNWEAIKEQERQAKLADNSVLADVATALPALTRACKLQRRAARIGFDWPDYRGALDKIDEEVKEVEAEIDSADPQRLEEEIGDVLFAVTNLARHLEVDPETALRRANLRFESRFREVEEEFTEQGREMSAETIEELEEAWQRAKAKLANQ